MRKVLKNSWEATLTEMKTIAKKCPNREIQHNRIVFSWRPAASKASSELRWKDRVTEQFRATSWYAKKHWTIWVLPEEQMKAAHLAHSIM